MRRLALNIFKKNDLNIELYLLVLGGFTIIAYLSLDIFTDYNMPSKLISTVKSLTYQSLQVLPDFSREAAMTGGVVYIMLIVAIVLKSYKDKHHLLIARRSLEDAKKRIKNNTVITDGELVSCYSGIFNITPSDYYRLVIPFIYKLAEKDEDFTLLEAGKWKYTQN